tara:strand:+ start:6787 stop:9954 length:3168 start_codon:yes stop_codon:yes gene_type:complete
MKKQYSLVVILAFVISLGCLLFNTNKTIVDESVRQTHKTFLDNSPFKNSKGLTKAQRTANSLPPNAYFEEEWELTMNPEKGHPTPENLEAIREQLNIEQASARVPGDAADNNWISRGPDNVGGRTRAIMFDPNDSTNETVFAGGVSGGLWKNTNISNANSTWTRVNIPENLNISIIIYDPNNTSTFYIGTGESYVGGDVNGDGVWKSSDSGTTWSKIFGGISGATSFQSAADITVNSPFGIAGNYLSFPTTAFGTTITATITADLILANDPSGVATEACNGFGANATGKIAIIRRGDCTFISKVKNAQNSGAIGVIMMNNVDGSPFAMGGTDATITIPSVMISKSDGDILETAINAGTVNGSLNLATGTFTGNLVPGIQHINDMKIRNNLGVSELYVAAGDSFYGAANATTYLGGPEYGLYKTIDGGANWSEVSLPLTANNRKHCPNDIEIASDNTIWLSTIESVLYGDGGGVIFSSTDGTNFTKIYDVPDSDRTQIAVSSTNAKKVYVLAETSTGVTIRVTSSGFVPASFVKIITPPNDLDPGVPTADFTRGQAFYDLMLEVNPTNDDIVFAGGIDAFKSSDEGDAWQQLTHWYGGFNRQYMHADQHSAIFANNDANKMLFSNDGGVFYSSDGGVTVSERNNGLITGQFYTVGVGPTTAFTTGDVFAGGLQDNGTQLFENTSTTGPDSTTEPYGGDGAYTFFDQDGTDRYFIRNFVFNRGINLYNFDGANVVINSEGANNGSFINPCALDSNLDILYTNYTSTANGNAIRRYSGIKSSGTITRTTLSDASFDNRPTAFTVSPHTTTSSTLFVGTILGDVFKITNANTTPIWTEIELQNIIVGSISDIEIGASENEIFVTIHNYGVESIWYTDNGGASWVSKEGNLPDMPVKSILQNPLNSEEVIIGTELGVWYTNNFSSASPRWSSSFNGMRNVKVMDLDVRNDNMVFAATYGRGVFSGMFTATSLSVIDEDELANSLKLFPTVSNGQFTLTSTKTIGLTQLEIYSITGKRVHKNSIDIKQGSRKQFDLNLNSGMYLVKLKGSNFETTKRIIIK